jgi:hypothetical protein
MCATTPPWNRMRKTLWKITQGNPASIRKICCLVLLLSCFASIANATTLAYTIDNSSTAVPDDVIVKPLTTGTVTNAVIGQGNGSSFTYTDTNYFNGKIDSVELYDRALWIKDIRALADK